MSRAARAPAVAHAALALAATTAALALAGISTGCTPHSGAGPSAHAPASRARAVPVQAVVGGEFWSARLAALSRAEAVCVPRLAAAGGAVAQGAPARESEVLGALALLSSDGSALSESFAASCESGCVRLPWRTCTDAGLATLRTIAAVRTGVASVESGETPVLSLHMLADAQVSFECAGRVWHAEVQSDYPWSGHVGVVMRCEGVQEGDGPLPLDLRIGLPEWLDPAAVRVSARGQMLSPGDCRIDGRALAVPGPWADGDRVHVSFPMEPREVPSADGVEIWRGPLRHVAEAVDQPPGALEDMSIAPSDTHRVMPFALAGAPGPVGAGEPAHAGASAAPQGVMAVIVDRRARGLPSLVLVPLMSAGNRGECARWGTFPRPRADAPVRRRGS